ncbi:MAG: F0F1 ATP synthase subunit B [Verrucomicrobia bacterium]|nr:F0F1 ATP synthase subunit B [Verrucomicrobiota bacterium]
MLIDWFTVVAQVINFLILVWLLQRFLYKPIVNAMRTREQKIASQLRDAENQKSEAEAESLKLRIAHDELEGRRQELLREAEGEAETLRQQLKEEARHEIKTVREKWQQALRDEQGAFRAELGKAVRQEVFSIATSVLADLAGVDVQGRMATMFIRRLEKLSAEERMKLSLFVTADGKAPVIRSAFELSPAAREAIEKAVAELVAADNSHGVRYEITPDLVGGIELTANGRKVSWSISDYLLSMEQRVQQLAAHRTKTHDQVE